MSANVGPLILACGPRPGGNSDLAAQLLARGLARTGTDPLLIRLRDIPVLPCTGCQACTENANHACVLAKRDRAEGLFDRIRAAPALFLAAPIYFYHLPGSFKCFIDRAQRFHAAREARDPDFPVRPERLAGVCLVAGRSRGEKLFEGSLLTLRYFLKPFDIRLADPLLLPGLDGPDDLRRSPDTQDRVVAYAEAVWAQAQASASQEGDGPRGTP